MRSRGQNTGFGVVATARGSQCGEDRGRGAVDDAGRPGAEAERLGHERRGPPVNVRIREGALPDRRRRCPAAKDEGVGVGGDDEMTDLQATYNPSVEGQPFSWERGF